MQNRGRIKWHSAFCMIPVMQAQCALTQEIHFFPCTCFPFNFKSVSFVIEGGYFCGELQAFSVDAEML
jgi:hypothetical protein